MRPGSGRCSMPDREEILRRLTLGDVTCLDSLVDERRAVGSGPPLDYVGEALVKLGALDAGLTADQVVDALVVLAPVIGGTRVVAVAPKLALATGFDVVAALELP